MKDKILNIRKIEVLIFVVVWVTIYSIPFFSHREFNIIDWDSVWRGWIRMSAYLLIFLANTLFLVPKLLFQKKYRLYVIFTFMAILSALGLGLLSEYLLISHPALAMPPMELGPGMPPMELGPGMPPPMGYKPTPVENQRSIWMMITDNMLISILVVGASTSVKMLSKWLNEENRRVALEKAQLTTELAMLRHQVSPHFLMNTLNNIHALVDINAEDAKNTLIQLSTMMRYLLYDTAHGLTTLKKEIAFIESYISLMQLRFPQEVEVTLSIPDDIEDIEIPPMLFISFLENAFKHGVSYKSFSFVEFRMQRDTNALKCVIRNSKFSHREKTDKTHSGIGMANSRKSLELLYGKEYSLNINETEKVYEVQLIIPVSHDKMHSH